MHSGLQSKKKYAQAFVKNKNTILRSVADAAAVGQVRIVQAFVDIAKKFK